MVDGTRRRRHSSVRPHSLTRRTWVPTVPRTTLSAIQAAIEAVLAARASKHVHHRTRRDVPHASFALETSRVPDASVILDEPALDLQPQDVLATGIARASTAAVFSEAGPAEVPLRVAFERRIYRRVREEWRVARVADERCERGNGLEDGAVDFGETAARGVIRFEYDCRVGRIGV